VVIFLFGLEALFTRGSRPSFVLSAPSPEQWDVIGCHVYQTSSYWLLERSNQFTITYILSTVWALGKSCLSTCRHPYSLAQSSYIMSLLLNWFQEVLDLGNSQDLCLEHLS
jgi:hypothetical protein